MAQQNDSVLEAMAQQNDDLTKKIAENSATYFRKYSAASADCEGSAAENSNMTFGESFELCRGFVIQPWINDTTGPVSY